VSRRPRTPGEAALALARHVLPEPQVERIRAAVRRARALLEQRVAPRLFGLRVRHVSGPERVEYGPDEVLAICIVRDGEAQLAEFLDHHFRLGVRHVVLLDNGSVDRTVEIARGYDRVTVLRTAARYSRYENVMKRYLARRFSTGRWNLMVDVDERFDYPFSGALPLRSLLEYLDRRGFTAVVSHMLDMFPDAPLSALAEAPRGPLAEAHPYFDAAAVRRERFRWGPAPQGVQEFRGGIRDVLFGTNNGLTKEALVRVDPAIELFVGWHHVRNARIADLTCVLLHYPFAEFHAKVGEALRSDRYGRFSIHYRRYLERLERDPGARLRGPAAERFRSAEALLENGFLVASDEFLAWAARRGARVEERAAEEGVRR
jgi:glycosyltransferase involved in cell wall biosynthesis